RPSNRSNERSCYTAWRLFVLFRLHHSLKSPACSCVSIRCLPHRKTDIWIADAHRDGKRFIVRADELLTAFLELASAIRLRRTLSEGVVADSPAWAGDALHKN